MSTTNEQGEGKGNNFASRLLSRAISERQKVEPKKALMWQAEKAAQVRAEVKEPVGAGKS